MAKESGDQSLSASSAEGSPGARQSEAAEAAAAADEDRGEGFVDDYLEERRRSSTSNAVSTSSRDDGDVRWPTFFLSVSTWAES